MTIEQQIIEYAKQQEPREMCGFVVFKGKKKQFIPCENIASDPISYFEVAADDWIKVQEYDGVIALVHSHPNGERALSTADRQMQIQSNLDWWLVTRGEIRKFRNVPPLLGRDFKHRESDCYTIICDAYMLAGTELPQVEYDEDWYEQGKDLYIETLKNSGFEQVTEPQLGDVILMQVISPVANHSAIYLGDNLMLQQCNNRLSKRDYYNGYWERHTHSIWRFKQWQQLDFTAIYNDLALSLS
ncbi:Proteasome lid subunit RPN8/RPN11, contains Jab1/MPN metalloenzyme (JAMM) motif [Pasteurella testudinis DSM 23072]|uniref:Proteasome lid subunit RPN8/RPN11, contains Jab1/MPN metalloenzyme (JAMM) motif n=1 Tax=Pasteurella testudinis DSM 23072 TaxID=1122938 RepID=A0A1W1V227_9PAST|nr:C40 family peptidase [Pasteurella testudinis]SMB87336.1 Proteasome lid subunit RPN8/RPN11, contains Jab1/MPN metalloenzyme (JAMM) motif [Pasteurella testudinis DSM 23072]SUB51644.1 (3R)-hydroxymyristoyl-ACP dehydratase [Pasteurella testudinis]